MQPTIKLSIRNSLALFLLTLISVNAQMHIEAEDYSDMLGIQTESTSDIGGGLNVGWFDGNDWMEYVIDVPVSGDYVISYRYASATDARVINLNDNVGGLIVAATLPATGDWQNWDTYESGLFNFNAGEQTLQIYTSTGGVNLNWFELKLIDAGDVTAPDVPVIVDSSSDVREISITWNKSTDLGTAIGSYRLYNGSEYLAATSDTTFTLSNLTQNTEFNINLTAVDLVGNESDSVNLVISTSPFPWELAWADEFEGTEVNTDNWLYQTGGGGWGNNEAQYYTNGANSSVADGNLIIEVRQETISTNNYTSSRMNSKVPGGMLYGRIEARIKLPSTGGTWPAFWTMPDDRIYGGWPSCGEIDIMEHTGNNYGRVFGTIHSEAFNHIDGTSESGGVTYSDVTDTWHVYALEWYPDRMEWYYDDVLVHTFENEYKTYAEWPFDVSHHVILNVAVGGGLGGTIDHDGEWPQRMYVDYVRYYDFNIGENDVEAPGDPTNLAVNATGSTAKLTWDAAADNEFIERYYVFLDDQLIDSTGGLEYTYYGLDQLTEYKFGVQAKDFGLNVSDTASILGSTEMLTGTLLPAIVQAEDYIDFNDIGTQATTDNGGGENVGWIINGSWLKYAVEVPTSEEYMVAYRVAATGSGGQVVLKDGDGASLTTVSVPATGGWQNWVTVTSEPFTFDAGTQIVEVYASSGGFNLNWIDFTTDLDKYPAGVQSSFSHNLITYPNPMQGDKLIIQTDDIINTAEITIYSVKGAIIEQRNILSVSNKVEINNLSLDKGLYILQMKTEQGMYSVKLIVE